MCFTVLLISLDGTVLNVALPTLVLRLHPSASGVQWIIDSFVLTEAVLLLVCGALGDRFGHRRAFLAGVVIFGAASLACAFAPSAAALIAARAATGVGAATLMPATLSLITASFPPWERPAAIGIWAGVSGIGTAAGPLAGGFLLEHFWWGSVFIINIPIAVLALAGGLAFLTEHRSPRVARFDPVGVVLSATGLAATTYGLITAPEEGWTAGPVLAGLVGGTALLAALGVWESRRGDPLVDFGLFRNATFSTGLGAVAAAFFAMFGVSLLLSQYIQFVQGAGVFSVGLRFLPMAAGTLVGSNTSTRLAARFGLRAVIVAGMLMISAALAIYSTLATGSSAVPVLVAFALVGFGLGIVIAPASNAVLGALPPDKIGVGSGLRATVQLLAGSFGVAIIGNVATSRYHAVFASGLRGPLGRLPGQVLEASRRQIGAAVEASLHLPPGQAATLRSSAGTAFASGIRVAAVVDLAVMAVATAAVARYIPTRSVSEAAADADRPATQMGMSGDHRLAQAPPPVPTPPQRHAVD